MRILANTNVGSKSPLSYTDIFYITTVFDNIKYEYIYFKEGAKYILSLLNKHTVLEKSGTTIRIDIKEGDVHKFTEELQKQLSYFSDVFINNSYRSYNNKFTIYEGKYFKFKSDNRPFDRLHLVLGEVAYPIDYDILGIKPIDFPIAIKFNIGEISPTLERENIKYDDSSIESIKERIDLAIQEVKNHFKGDTFELDNLKDYLRDRKKTPYLYFNKQLDHKIKATHEIGIKKDYRWKPLKDVKEYQIPDENIFFMFDIYELYGNKIIKTDDWRFIRSWLESYNVKILFKEDSNFNNATTNYWLNHSNTTYVFVPKKKNYKKALEILQISTAIYSPANYNRIRKSLDETYYSYLQRINRNNSFELGKSKLIYKYIKSVKDHIIDISTHYDSADSEWISEYKEEQRLAALQQKESLKQRVVYYNSNNSRTDIQLSELLKHKYIFYRIKENYNNSFSEYKSILDKFYGDVPNNNTHHTQYVKKQRFINKFAIFISISESQFKRIKKFNKLIHISEFYKTKELQNTLYKCKLANLINTELQYDHRPSRNISNYYRILIEDLYAFKIKYSLYNNLEEISIKKLNPSCHEIILKLKEYRKIKDKLEIFKYITNMPDKYLVIIIKSLKMTKFNSNLYKLNTKEDEYKE